MLMRHSLFLLVCEQCPGILGEWASLWRAMVVLGEAGMGIHCFLQGRREVR